MPRLREYLRPSTVSEAIEMLRAGPGRGCYIAGGTFLGQARKTPYDSFVDITRIGLGEIGKTGRTIRIGATATIQALADSPLLSHPELRFLAQAARSVAGRQIRNMATVAGDLVSGYLLVDLPAAFLVLDAELILAGTGRDRTALRNFFSDPALKEEKGWLVTGIDVPVPAPGSRGFFIKFARTENDVAMMNLACLAYMDRGRFREVRMAVGATVARPVRLTAAEDFLRGQPAKEKVIREAAGLAIRDLALMDNIRGSRDYRRQVLGVLLRRALRSCSEEGGPER